MTIKKAREILGEYAKGKSDQEIEEMVLCFNALIEVGIRQFEREHKVEVNINKSKKKS